MKKDKEYYSIKKSDIVNAIEGCGVEEKEGWSIVKDNIDSIIDRVDQALCDEVYELLQDLMEENEGEQEEEDDYEC